MKKKKEKRDALINVLTFEMCFIGGDYCDGYELNSEAAKGLRQTDRQVACWAWGRWARVLQVAGGRVDRL